MQEGYEINLSSEVMTAGLGAQKYNVLCAEKSVWLWKTLHNEELSGRKIILIS